MTKREALKVLKDGEKLNPGPWIDHSLNVGHAAHIITKKTGEHDAERAYVYGVLHDIGRRYGFSHIKHTLDGFHFLKDTDIKAAYICLSHSFPNKNIQEYQGEMDLSESELMKMESLLKAYQYDYYDQLIQLCDSLCSAEGFVKMEVRWVDVAIRNGINDFIIQKWKKIRNIKSSLNKKYSINIEHLLEI